MSGKTDSPASNNRPGPEPNPAPLSGGWLCFAVHQEAAFLPRTTPARLIITGIGPHQARRTLARALDIDQPPFVLTCGFAGGLNPRLIPGTVLFEPNPDFPWTDQLAQAGATPARFLASPHVITSAREKARLYQTSGADAVEMESEALRLLCQQHGIPAATVRVISDAARQDLPLDFNRLLDAQGRLQPARLAWAILRHPGCLPGLVALRRQTRLASRRLAAVLQIFLNPGPATTHKSP